MFDLTMPELFTHNRSLNQMWSSKVALVEDTLMRRRLAGNYVNQPTSFHVLNFTSHNSYLSSLSSKINFALGP